MIWRLVFLLLIAPMFGYQWPVSSAAVDVGFLGGDSRTGEVSLGMAFSDADQAAFFADGEVIYLQEDDHPLALPTDRESLVVLRHQDWLISYLISGMSTEGFSEQKPVQVTEGSVFARRGDENEPTRVKVEFYDFKSDVVVSPRLMLPERESATPAFTLLASVPKKDFLTRLRPESYLYPDDYLLLFGGKRVPLRIQFYYDRQKLSELDLSTVEQRGGQLYTNAGLTRLSDLQRGKNLEIARLQVGGALRQWHVLQAELHFNDLRAVSDQYRVYVLPPKGG